MIHAVVVMVAVVAVSVWPRDKDGNLQQQSAFFALAAAPKGRDFYKILGVPRDANEKQIKKAYFQLSKKVNFKLLFCWSHLHCSVASG
jgi:hypothetical protein